SRRTTRCRRPTPTCRTPSTEPSPAPNNSWRSREGTSACCITPASSSTSPAVPRAPSCCRRSREAMVMPETRYARTADGVSIAYAVVGDGPRDLVAVPGWVSQLEVAWEEPTLARFYERLATFSRLILFDKRGTGLSDRVPESQLPDLETRMDDLRTVCVAAGSEQAALLG